MNDYEIRNGRARSAVIIDRKCNIVGFTEVARTCSSSLSRTVHNFQLYPMASIPRHKFAELNKVKASGSLGGFVAIAMKKNLIQMARCKP